MSAEQRSRAVWGIVYDLAEEGRADYLAWFHDVHIDEKLARDGYTWAAHYQVVTPQGEPAAIAGSGNGHIGYIALFGGDDTAVFLDPSPAQLKPKQPQLSRDMMGMRIGSRSFIAAEEWHCDAADDTGARGHEALSLTWSESGANDETFGAWCVQDLKPSLLKATGFQTTSKLLSATGPAKHVVLSEFNSLEALAAFDTHMAQNKKASEMRELRGDLAGTPLCATRIWPPAD